MFAELAAKAAEREERVEQGEFIQRDVKPTAPQAPPSAPGAFDLAAMVSGAARDREKRLAGGGEKKMRIVKEKEEYKEQYNPIAIEAAELGRLTRLNEHVVEAVAGEKEKEEGWASKGLMAIEWRTNHMAVIHEAARLGNETKMREHIACNYEDEEDDIWYEGEYAIPYERMRALEKAESKVEQHVILQKMLDDGDATRGIVRPMYMYNDISKVVLPKGRLPKYDQTKGKEELAKMSHPLSEIGNEVIKRAWERRRRLDQEDAEPHMRTVCNCGYCGTASPHQTFAYRVVEGRVKGAHIPEEIQKELASREGKKYKVLGKGGKTRITRALKVDAKTGEIDKEKHFYAKEKERQKQLAEQRTRKAMPRKKSGRVSRTKSSDLSDLANMRGAAPVARSKSSDLAEFARSRAAASVTSGDAASAVRGGRRRAPARARSSDASPLVDDSLVQRQKEAERARIEAQIRAMEEEIAKQKRQAEERARVEAEIRAMEEEIARQKRKVEERARLEAEIKAMEEQIARQKQQAAVRARQDVFGIVEGGQPVGEKQNGATAAAAAASHPENPGPGPDRREQPKASTPDNNDAASVCTYNTTETEEVVAMQRKTHDDESKGSRKMQFSKKRGKFIGKLWKSGKLS